MRIYLMRHSLAVDAGSGLDDSSRYLTLRGRKRVRDVCVALVSKRVELDTIVCSPLTRAVQTAELLARSLGYEDLVQTHLALLPGSSPQVAGQLAPSLGRSVAMVGHEPTISAIGAFFLSRPSFPPFRPGQVTLIERGQGAWTLNPERLDFEDVLK